MSELQQLQERVRVLEEQMREVRGYPGASDHGPWWKRKAGLFAGDEAFDEIVRLGAKARRADRPKSSPSRRTSKRAAPAKRSA
jgi:hypothetical protein